MKNLITLKFSVFLQSSFMLMLFVFTSNHALGQGYSITVDTITTLIDGSSAPYNQLKPGDTLYLEPGVRRLIRIKNLSGSSGKPVIITNHNGKVVFDSDYTYGISILNCNYIRLTGTGSPGLFYGISISRVTNGSGIGLGGLTSDYEIDHVSIENCKSVGIFAKTDPDCSFLSTRDKFTQFNTLIHDNYIAKTGTEAMYIGSTMYFGQKISCNGVDTLLMPSLLDGVKVYNNKIEYSGWDGIQVSSASRNCQIFNNEILYSSQAEYYGQMSGITIGGGSKCDCYNNFISQGKGMGIENFGLGGNKIFNNIIVDAGKNFLPADSSRQVHGIFVTDVSTEADSSFYIFNNDIINPMSDGIRFQSEKSRGSIIVSNLIVNPGNFDLYENLRNNFRGVDAYLMIPSSKAEVFSANNYFTRSLDSARISSTDYIPRPGSPLINSGWPGSMGIKFDYRGKPRHIGMAPEIGALEFDPTTVGLYRNHADKNYGSTAYPNPARQFTTISYNLSGVGKATILISDLQGRILIKKEAEYFPDGQNNVQIDTSDLDNGLYMYFIKKGAESLSGKLLKVN